MADLSGQYLGRYYLTERLGEGGMATVYKGYDTRLERDVAVKIIRSAAFPEEELIAVLKRFEREAKALAKLSHPNIVKVHDYGEHDGSPYLVMEYLPGGTLKKVLGKPIFWQEAVQLILPIARGVAYAHRQGILHRDIKPANILITESEEPMLSDFGIARLFEGEQATALTGSGIAIGTPEYMAPEQWTGVTSPQSDLYSLGIVLYELVAGRKPYVADTPAAILLKQATEPLPSPRKFVADLPESLELVLVKALARNPENRYKDLNAFIDALKNLRMDVPDAPAEVHTEAATQVSPPQPAAPHIPNWHDDQTVRAREPALDAANEQAKHESAGVAQPEKVQNIDIRQAGIHDFLSRYLRPKQFRKGWGFYSLIILAMFAILALAISMLPHPSVETPPTVTATSGTIIPAPLVTPLVFSVNSGSEVNVYVYDPANKTLSIMVAGGKNWDPVMAGSGNIYFTSNRDGKAEIYRRLVNGNIERVTNTPESFESWAPAPGKTGNIYFTSNQQDHKAEIYRLIDGKIERVTYTPGRFESWGPALGTSGNIYFTSDQQDNKAEIYRLINGKMERVTYTPGQFQSWGPVLGTSGNIYFTSDQQDNKAEIYRLINGKIERVTNMPGQAESWSPILLGQNVYFTSNKSGQSQVYLLGPQVIEISSGGSWTNLLIEKSPPY